MHQKNNNIREVSDFNSLLAIDFLDPLTDRDRRRLSASTYPVASLDPFIGRGLNFIHRWGDIVYIETNTQTTR